MYQYRIVWTKLIWFKPVSQLTKSHKFWSHGKTLTVRYTPVNQQTYSEYRVNAMLHMLSIFKKSVEPVTAKLSNPKKQI